MKLKFPPAPHSGAYPVIAENLAKSYGEHVIFQNVDLTIHRGDKVAFVGKNGAGKTTLVKCIMGEIDDFTGTLTLGHLVKIGYFAQNQAQLLDENSTVFDTVDDVAKGDIRTRIRDILGAFMFGGEASDKKVAMLSGGERSRLAMIRLLLETANLLILDEPTNHLDMRSKDVLKNALNAFDGTVIVVSHDREFLDGLVQKVYEFGNQQVKEHLGGIYDFLNRKKLENLQELEVNNSRPSTETGHAPSVQPAAIPSHRHIISHEDNKEFSKKVKRLEKSIAGFEAQINSLEAEIAEIDKQLATPTGAADSHLYSRRAQLITQLDYALRDWEKDNEQLEIMHRNNSS
jgi:ATP-binding cassette subfamily F protein 3